MFRKLLFRLFFRATLTLALMLGLGSFAHYLSGGDPGALWRGIGSGASDRVVAAFGNAQRSVANLADEAGDRVRRMQATGADASADGATAARDARSTRVWSWRDADGVTHYSSTAPVGINAAVMHVDPDVNVLQAVRAADVPASRESRSAASADRSTAAGTRATGGSAAPRDEFAEGEPLPGIAGALQRSRGSNDTSDPARAEALLKLLQSGSR